MSMESAAPPNARSVYRVLITAGVVAAVVGATTIGIIVFNFVTRPELHDPVRLEDAHGFVPPPAWLTRI